VRAVSALAELAKSRSQRRHYIGAISEEPGVCGGYHNIFETGELKQKLDNKRHDLRSKVWKGLFPISPTVRARGYCTERICH
jgi:hypothetical protein